LQAEYSSDALSRFLALALLASPQVGLASDDESPPVLDASEIVGDLQLVGEQHAIVDTVPCGAPDFLDTVLLQFELSGFEING
jgi:hypothetical protein